MRLLGIANLSLVGLTLLAIVCWLFAGNAYEPLTFTQRPEQKELPRSPFADMEEFFQEIGKNVFTLKSIPPQLQLPDLRNHLLFFGKNLRPDAKPEKPTFHIGLKGSDVPLLVKQGQRVYLTYQGSYSSDNMLKKRSFSDESISHGHKALWGEVSKNQSESMAKHAYAFSPDNQPTPLWFEAKAIGEQTVEIHVSMLDEKGFIVSTPQDFSLFHCQAQEFPKSQLLGWELGGHRVDTTLLVRQKARWVGPDLFLAFHGGDEFSYTKGKERIDFQDGGQDYCCFVEVGDFLIWKERQWVAAQSNEETEKLPLLVVKKMDDKLMSFELWDPIGRGKTFLNLIRSREHSAKPNISQEMKFVGSKTWAQFIVECSNGARMTLRPNDWLLLTAEGWQKLDSPEQIDAYVNQALTGPLFILDKMTKQNGKQSLVGHLFNATRTEMEQIELTSSSSTSLANYYQHVPMSPPLQASSSQIKPPDIYSEGYQE